MVFVSGYYRRPPGKGRFSETARTVWVRPYIRGLEHMEHGAQPETTSDSM